MKLHSNLMILYKHMKHDLKRADVKQNDNCLKMIEIHHACNTHATNAIW